MKCYLIPNPRSGGEIGTGDEPGAVEQYEFWDVSGLRSVTQLCPYDLVLSS